MEVGHLFKKTLVIIPARKNSKGILNKNLIDINGKPLIDFTFKFISDNGLTQNTIISTDSTDILNYAKEPQSVKKKYASGTYKKRRKSKLRKSIKKRTRKSIKKRRRKSRKYRRR